MKKNVEKVLSLFGEEACQVSEVPAHEGGRNQIFILERENAKRVLRISALGDRTEEDYLAETEFVHYLAENGAAAAEAMLSIICTPSVLRT